MHLSSRFRAGTLAALVLAAAARAHAAAPLEPPRQYRIHGTADVTIEGPNCCWGSPLRGRFDAVYDIAASGAATLRDFQLGIDDAMVVVRGGFLGLGSETVWLRCGSASLTAHGHGALVAPDRVQFPVGTVQMEAFAAEAVGPEGDCPDPTLAFGGANSSAVVVTHKPGDNRVDLDATLSLSAEGAVYTMHIVGAGAYSNRPPQAALAFRLPDGSVPQGGCPAFPFWNGQMWEQVAEANGPGGLTASLLSYSSDADGTWGAADVLNDLWFDTRGGGERLPLARGRSAGPFVFGWGADHDVQLMALDHESAASVASRRFRVADTRPPVVTAPAPLVIGCSTAGGATRATSPALDAFLRAATAADVVDTTPTALPPQVGGVDVTPTTLFPANNLARAVRFRFRDDAGRTGTADSPVTVRDVIPPVPTVTAAPSVVPPSPSLAFFTVATSLTAADACGGTIAYRLKSIKSNAPLLDATDVTGASFGTDDRSFQLRARPAKPGVTDRLYTIVYEAIDASGNFGAASAVVRVRAL